VPSVCRGEKPGRAGTNQRSQSLLFWPAGAGLRRNGLPPILRDSCLIRTKDSSAAAEEHKSFRYGLWAAKWLREPLSPPIGSFRGGASIAEIKKWRQNFWTRELDRRRRDPYQPGGQVQERFLLQACAFLCLVKERVSSRRDFQAEQSPPRATAANGEWRPATERYVTRMGSCARRTYSERIQRPSTAPRWPPAEICKPVRGVVPFLPGRGEGESNRAVIEKIVDEASYRKLSRPRNQNRTKPS